jgi:hypothetical protein
VKNDDAIAPIIAVMLILVVVVTLLSVYNATYLPGLKQSAEIQHLHEVEEGVLKFGSALEEAASLKRNISLSQQIPLGGGDILLNSLKSGGSLHVQQESEPYLTIEIDGQPPFYLQMVNFSYWTVNNFWVDQGYTWQYGYVNVSRRLGSGGGTPLQYATMAKVREKNLNVSSLGNTLIDVEKTQEYNSEYTVKVVNFIAGEDFFSSGNGIGRLELKAATNESVFQNNLNVSFIVNKKTDFYNCLEFRDGQHYDNVTLIMTNITVSAY